MMSALMGALTWGIGTVNRPRAVHRLQRTIAQTPGCVEDRGGGAHRFTRPGWISTDKGRRTPHFVHATAAWPFPSGCAERVYSDNVIEHIPMEWNRRLSREAHRVMRRVGVFEWRLRTCGAWRTST